MESSGNDHQTSYRDARSARSAPAKTPNAKRGTGNTGTPFCCALLIQGTIELYAAFSSGSLEPTAAFGR